jgi:hypothetical protein
MIVQACKNLWEKIELIKTVIEGKEKKRIALQPVKNFPVFIFMTNISRITSILNTPILDSSITGLPSFYLSALSLPNDLDFSLPTDLRLGHLVEKIVAVLIQSSTNYTLLYENIQLTENKQTIGEMDFILSHRNTKELIHVELAYKFYLYDPGISSTAINNWIGPNRNDFLKEKLDKLKNKQFPLLYHPAARSALDQLAIKDIAQKLCFLVSLFVPYQYEINFSAAYQQAIKGYYLNLESFIGLDHSERTYYLPLKREWGIDPAENENWQDFEQIHTRVSKSIAEKRALLCWQKHKDSYSTFFIVWW